MKTHLAIIFFLSVILISCEDVGIIETEIPYSDLIVISGQIQPNQTDPIISITKSIPLTNTYAEELTSVDNAVAYILSEQYGYFKLKNIGSGKYQGVGLNIRSDETYELFINIDGRRINASAKVPQTPKILSTRIENDHIVCEVNAKVDEVYSCIYVVSNNFNSGNPTIRYSELEFFQISSPVDKNGESVIIRSGEIPSEYLSSSSGYRLGVQVYAWDKAYKEYYSTKDNNNPIQDIFSQGGGTISWNVYGENVIGLFMGYTYSTIFDIQ